MDHLTFDVSPSAEEMSRRAADVVVADLKEDPRLLLCASAGGTPTGLYSELAARRAAAPRLFARMRVILVDEWGGIPKGQPGTCREDVLRKLVQPLGINGKRFVAFDSSKPIAAEAERISEWLLKNGPIGICILGLGTNGHVAMNEPRQSFVPFAHLAKLAPASLKHPLLSDIPKKPRFGLTLGMSEILASKRVMLLVSGSHKRGALTRLKRPEATPRFPASALWLHSRATVFCDSAAWGGSLKN